MHCVQVWGSRPAQGGIIMKYGKMLFVVTARVDPTVEADWNDWYSNVHLPEISSCPGFNNNKARYVGDAPAGRRYLALYSIDSPDALQSSEFNKMRGWGAFGSHVEHEARLFKGIGIGDEQKVNFGKMLWVVFARIEPTVELAWNDWYSNQHLPEIADCPGFAEKARYVGEAPAGRRYLTLYDIEAPEAIDSPEFNARRGWGPFSAQVEAEVILFHQIDV
jgi:hypothetical protein